MRKQRPKIKKIPKGKEERKRKPRKEAIVQQYFLRRAVAEDITPLQFMETVMREEVLPVGIRLEAAKSAGPYRHRRKPISIDGGEGKPITIATAEQLAKMSAEDLEKLNTILTPLALDELVNGKPED